MNKKRVLEVFFWIAFIPALVSCASDSKNGENELNIADTENTYTCESNPMRPNDLFKIADALKTATNGQGDPSATHVALVPPYLTPFWITPQIGASRAALELGCPLDFTGANKDSPNQAAEQQTIVDSLIERGIKGMAVACKDAELMESSIVTATELGIPVITFDADGVEDSARHLYLGTANFSAGRTAGEKMVELLGNKGKKVALFLNSPNDANLEARKKGIEAAFEGTSISLVESYSHEGDLTLLRENLSKAINDHVDLAGMISVNGHIGPILGDVLAENGQTGKIQAVVFDLLNETQEHLLNDVVQAVIVQEAYFFGYLGAHIIYSMATIGVNETMSVLAPWLEGDTLDTGVTVLTNENFNIYRDFLTCLGVSAS